MAVGASKPTVVADKSGFFSVKSQMLVSLSFKEPVSWVLVILKRFNNCLRVRSFWLC